MSRLLSNTLRHVNRWMIKVTVVGVQQPRGECGWPWTPEKVLEDFKLGPTTASLESGGKSKWKQGGKETWIEKDKYEKKQIKETSLNYSSIFSIKSLLWLILVSNFPLQKKKKSERDVHIGIKYIIDILTVLNIYAEAEHVGVWLSSTVCSEQVKSWAQSQKTI